MKQFKKIALKTSCFFTIGSLIYILLLTFSVSGTPNVSDVYSLILKNHLAMLAFSIIFGVSYLIFDIKKMPQAAKRFLHILINYVAMLVTFFVMAAVDKRSQIIFAFVATFIFIVVYATGEFIASVYRKKTMKTTDRG
ncbi:MAG: DUF3021 family protein [Clostridia bacterium]